MARARMARRLLSSAFLFLGVAGVAGGGGEQAQRRTTEGALPVWIQAVSSAVSVGASGKRTHDGIVEDSGMLETLKAAVKRQERDEEALSSRKLHDDEVSKLELALHVFKLVKRRCVDEPKHYTSRLGRWAKGIFDGGKAAKPDSEPLGPEEAAVIDKAAAAMAKEHRRIMDSSVCPVLRDEAVAAMKKVLKQLAVFDRNRGVQQGTTEHHAELDSVRYFEQYHIWQFDSQHHVSVEGARVRARNKIRNLASKCDEAFEKLMAKPRGRWSPSELDPDHPWDRMCEAHKWGYHDLHNALRPGGAIDDIVKVIQRVTGKPEVQFIFDVTSVVGLVTSGPLGVAANMATLTAEFVDRKTTPEDCWRAYRMIKRAEDPAPPQKAGTRTTSAKPVAAAATATTAKPETSDRPGR